MAPKAKMPRILYVDAVGPFGGASRSLFEAISVLPLDAEKFFVMQEGSAVSYYRQFATDIVSTIGLSRFDNTRASGYKRLRWVVVLREVFFIPFTVIALIKAKLRWKQVDLIHVNEIVDIIPGILAKWLFAAPMIVHTRCLCRSKTSSFRTRFLHWLLKRYVDQVIAIDENVRSSLPDDLDVEIIHNSFNPAGDGRISDAAKVVIEKVRSSALKVVFVGNLQRSKGLLELIQGVQLARKSGADIQLVVVGGVTGGRISLTRRLASIIGLSQDLDSELRFLLNDEDLRKNLVMVGHAADINNIFPLVDILAFTSHLDAPGRPVFEAAFFGVPSIVAVSAPKPDTVQDGKSAIAIQTPDPALICDAILRLYNDRDLLASMGEAARQLAEKNFRPEKNAKLLAGVYRRMIS